MEEERKRKAEIESRMEEERLESLRLERVREQQRLDNELQLKGILKEQMAELQRREQEVWNGVSTSSALAVK